MNTTEITSKNPLQLANITFLLKNDNATYETHLDGQVQVVKYNPAGAYPVAAIFKNKKKNPVAHYRYNNNEDRDAAIARQIEQELSNQKWKADRKAKATKAEIKVGDILYTSWGYDQTNIDFYLVVGLVGKATAEYVKIGSEQVDTTSWCSAKVKPDLTNQGTEVNRGRIGQYGVKIGREHASVTGANETHHSSWGH